jgi:hypothetical protein
LRWRCFRFATHRPQAFLVKILAANTVRLGFNWGAVEGYLLLLMDDARSVEPGAAAFLRRLSAEFNENSEKCLMITFERMFTGRKHLSSKIRSSILVQVRQTLAEKGLLI